MTLSSERGKFKSLAFDPSYSKLFSYAGAALDFLNMAKDTVDTFKPYKTSQHRTRDLWQFYDGLKNTLKAVLFIPLSALVLIASLIYLIMTPLLGLIQYLKTTSKDATLVGEIKEIYSMVSQMMGMSAENLVGSLAQTIRGVTQMVTAPLTLLRIPLRMYLSKDMPEQKFQDRKSIQRLLNEADDIMATNDADATSNMRPIIDELHRKSYNQVSTKQATYGNKDISVAMQATCGFVTWTEHLKANCFFKDKRVTGRIKQEEIIQIKSRLDEFRIPAAANA